LSMAVTIKEVQSRRKLKSFIYFPYWLYRDNRYWIPPMVKDEFDTFNKKRNPIYKTADAQLLLAYKDRRVAGRVAIIAHYHELEKEGKLRFGWLDFEDDKEVSSALFQAIEDAAREVGARVIEGPLGFSDLDRAGMLIEGFEEVNNMTTWYNAPHYQKHIEAAGYAKKKDWIEFQYKVPNEVPDRIERMAELVENRYALRELPIRNKADMRKVSVRVLKLMGDTYKKLYNYVPLTDSQMAFYAEQFLNFLPPQNVMVLLDVADRFVAFAVTMPSLIEAARKTQGHLYPFGFLRFLHAMKNSKRVELLLIGVHPDYQNKGVTALLFKKLIALYIKKGVEVVESNPQQEDNKEIQALFAKDYASRQHKRRRVFIKKIDP
jgi:GNAT superfamily N-acetyltransferase